jgi:hypothetical protein
MSADAKEKKPKKTADAAPAAEATPAAAPAAPRAPADPRLKVWKKFKGRFLPKGPLRDRLNDLTARWKASEDHSGVTVEELKALHADWMTSRMKGKKPAKA